MTRNRSSRGRRRNRSRPEDAVDQAVAPDLSADDRSTGEGEAAPEPGSGPPRERRRRRPGSSQEGRHAGAAPQPQGREAADQQERRPRGGGDGREGGQRPNRRRQGRRQQPQPYTSGEVFKANVRTTGGRNEPQAIRPVLKSDEEDLPVLGCPMLTRTRAGIPFAGGRHVPRCALAWTIHSETEASYCMETPAVALCWKLHPERLEEIRARLAERAAD